MTDLMHVYDVANEINPSQKAPKTTNHCTVFVFMTAVLALIGAGVFGLWNLTVVHSEAFGRGFLIFASAYSSGSVFHFLWKISHRALDKGEPFIERVFDRIIRSLDAFFGSCSWCNRQLRA